MSLPDQEWEFEVGAPDHGTRLDTFVGQRLRWRSRTRIRSAIERGRVAIEPYKDPQAAAVGRLRAGLRLRAGQRVRVRLPAPWAERGQARSGSEPADLHVVYEDRQLLAVNKPPGVSVYPSPRHRSGSMIEWVHGRERRRGESEEPPHLCHRLDRETSGLLLFAKGRPARVELNRQFERRRVGKVYLALVCGEVAAGEGLIDLPLGPAEDARVEIRRGVRRDAEGQPAVTAWRVRRKLAGRTLLEVRPETGRQHQIRVHLAAIGHPIAGDKLYLGGDDLFLRWLDGELQEADWRRLGHPRQALHAWRLELQHPETRRPLVIEAPLWEDLARLPGLS